MFVIGITGGTGTGKTTALNAVEKLGGAVIDCDALYHALLKTDTALLNAIEAAFPGVVENGELQRKKLGAIVFGDAEKLNTLNGITNGFIDRAVRAKLDVEKASGRKLVAIDAIGLIESGLGRYCNQTAAVTAPEEVRVQRLIKRESITEEYARLRIRAQKSAEWFAENCDITLSNAGSREEFEEECLRRFSALLEEEKPMGTEILEALESGVRSYSRAFPTEFSRAKMSRMYTPDGKSYLDFFNGAGALNYGHNNDYIKEQIVNYLMNDGITHALDMFTGAKAEFFQTLDEKILKPRGLDYKIMSCGPTGTNAVEAALKLARKVTGRTGVLALTGSFHGMTLGSLSVTSGVDHREGAHVPLPFTTFLPHPCAVAFDTIEYYRWLLTDNYSGIEKPAAIIIETTQAEGGVNVAPTEWLRKLRALCDEQDILLIVDDIQVGCGRTGTFFSFERAGIVPDMVVLSKSISGYGLPMSLLLIKPEIDKFYPAEHNGTFRGNQLAFVGAKAAIEYRELVNLDAQVKEKEAIIVDFIEKKLLPMDSRLEHRGIGMIQGVDFEKIGDVSGLVAKECFRWGLIIERAGRNDCVLKIMPALTITKEELMEGLSIIEESMKTVLGGLNK